MNPFFSSSSASSSHSSASDILLYGLAPQRCAICASKSPLKACGACKVVSYCGTEHQTAHQSEHKAACAAIRRSREALEHEEAVLRAKPADFMLPADVFNNGVGNFWGIYDTRDYMRARFTAADTLLRVDTVRAVETALGHFNDMLRLCRSDNLGVRDIIPCLLLRLGREQECYDFLKWWAVIDDKGQYAFGDVASPYLDIRGADAFEPVDIFCSGQPSLSHLVALTLLKLRSYLDLEAYEDMETEIMFGQYSTPFSTEPDRKVGQLVRAKLRSLDPMDVPMKVQALKMQYHKLCKAVNDANPHFWGALVDESEETPTPPPHFSFGSKEEADLALYQCKRAWEESEDAIVMVDSDTSKFASVYEGPAAVTVAGRSDVVEEGAVDLERRRATGSAFPSKFQPPPSVSSPAELFPPTPMGSRQTVRFVCRDDRRKLLVYVDGACANNGQSEPRAGWAVVCGPPDCSSFVVSGRLENKGPFGGASVATSSRAELRAAIAALRLCNWKDDGFDSIVIATDSSYVVDGATDWAVGWIRNGWKKRTGGEVKNRDLWDLLLGEVERWKDRGLSVEVWRIPRELNGDADAAAKQASNKTAAEAKFRDVVTGSSRATTAGTEKGRRILALCLESESMFDDVFGSLVSSITSNAKMQRATTREVAFNMLIQEPPPSVILVADGALTRQRKLWERVIDRLRDGATVVLAGCFSGMVSRGQFNRFFATVGLPWESGSYQRTTVKLRHGVAGVDLASRLPATYSVKALYVKNVETSAAWYMSSEVPGEAAVAFTKVGLGRLGYVGDVNGEKASDAVVLAMCGLQD